MSTITSSDPSAKPALIRQPDAVELSLNALSAIVTTISVVETFARGEDISYLPGERPLNKRRYIGTVVLALSSGIRLGGLIGVASNRASGKQAATIAEVGTRNLVSEALSNFALMALGAAELAGLKTLRRRGQLSGFGKVGGVLALGLAAYRTVATTKELYRRYNQVQANDNELPEPGTLVFAACYPDGTIELFPGDDQPTQEIPVVADELEADGYDVLGTKLADREDITFDQLLKELRSLR